MKLFTPLLCFLLCTSFLFAQKGFEFTSNRKKVTIPFQLVNNLIIIPIKVNGVELNFLLDTGVEETILFSLDEKEEVKLYDVQKVKLKGLGDEAATEGLKSSRNTLAVPGLKSVNQDILIVLDEEFNFSSSLGIPVNGIIGYHFFKNNLIEINYSRKKLYVYNQARMDRGWLLKQYEALDISIENAKPYFQAALYGSAGPMPAKCLIDTGNSDPVWLFENQSDKIRVPARSFEDFLGRGFNGDVHGRRGKIPKFSIGSFEFNNPISSFPDPVSLRNVRMVKDRLGSIGGELLKRFTVIFDYQGQKLYLKKNRHYSETFKYNTSGISVHHIGLQWITEATPFLTELNVSSSDESQYTRKESAGFKYSFKLKPLYEVSTVRKNSVAEKAGVKKGDIILSINKKSAYALSLQEINALLKADAGHYIQIEVKRNNKELRFRFQLEELL